MDAESKQVIQNVAHELHVLNETVKALTQVLNQVEHDLRSMNNPTTRRQV